MAEAKGGKKGILDGLKGLIGPSPGKAAGEKAGGDRKMFRETTNTNVTKFDTAAIKQLKGLLGKGGEKGPPGKETPKAQPSWLKRLLGPAFFLLAGIAAFIGALMTSGPLKGLLGFMGKTGMKIGLKLLAKSMGKILKPVLKFIPVVGSIMSWAIAYTRFKDGQYLKGTIDLISGIVGLLPGMGPFLSIGLDVLNALLDVGEHFKVADMGGFGAGRMIFQIVLKLLAPLSKTLRMIPFLGSLVGFGAAYLRFKENQIIRGTIELVGAVAGLFPGIGQGIMWGAMVLNAILDFGGSASGKKFAGGKNFGFFALILKIVAPFAKFLKVVPFLGSIIGFGISYMYFKTGKWIQGTLELIGAIAGLFPGIGQAVMWGLSILNMLLDAFGVGGKEEAGKAEPSILSKIGKFFWDIVKTTFPFNTFIHGYKAIKALFKGDLKGAAIHFMYAIPVIGTLLHWIMGPAEEQLEGEEVPGSKGSMWSKVLDVLFQIPPISNFVNLYKGIKNLFQGNFGKAAAHFLFAIPLVGNLLEWFAGDAIMEEAEKPSSDKASLWTVIKDFVLSMPPFSNVYHFGKGIFALFSGEWSSAADHFIQSIPFIGNIISFLAGSEGEGEADSGKPQGSIFQRLKEGVIKKFKGAWDYMPGWAKWAARKVLPDEFVRMLDNPSPEYHDEHDLPIEGSKQPEPPKRDAAEETKKSLLRQYVKVWKTLPLWMKWIAKAVLPREVYSALQKGDVGDIEFESTKDQAKGLGQATVKIEDATAEIRKAGNKLIKTTRTYTTIMSRFSRYYLSTAVRLGRGLVSSTTRFIRALSSAMQRAIKALAREITPNTRSGSSFWDRIKSTASSALSHIPGMSMVKMPIAESWRRRATPERTVLFKPGDPPVHVKVIGPVQLKKEGETPTDGLEGLVAFSRGMNEKLFPELLAELREGAIVTKLDEINQSVQANKPVPNFLGGGGGGAQPGPINNLRRQHTNVQDF